MIRYTICAALAVLSVLVIMGVLAQAEEAEVQRFQISSNFS